MTTIVKDAKKLTQTGIDVVVKDIFDLEMDDLKDYDVVVNAFNAPAGQKKGMS